MITAAYWAAITTIQEYGLCKQLHSLMQSCDLDESFQRAGCKYRLPSYDFFEVYDTKFIEKRKRKLLKNLKKLEEYADKHHLERITMIESFKILEDALENIKIY